MPKNKTYPTSTDGTCEEEKLDRHCLGVPKCNLCTAILRSNTQQSYFIEENTRTIITIFSDEDLKSLRESFGDAEVRAPIR